MAVADRISSGAANTRQTPWPSSPTDGASARAFEPGTAVNYESVFYGPRMAGLTYLIDTLIFKQDTAELASRMPRGLTVVEW